MRLCLKTNYILLLFQLLLRAIQTVLSENTIQLGHELDSN